MSYKHKCSISAIYKKISEKRNIYRKEVNLIHYYRKNKFLQNMNHLSCLKQAEWHE